MERRVALINQLIGLGLTLAMCWMLIPQHKRRLWLMKLAQSMPSQSQKLAQTSARAAMSRELAGDATSAETGYTTAYRLMTEVHDKAGHWYEKLRGAS